MKSLCICGREDCKICRRRRLQKESRNRLKEGIRLGSGPSKHTDGWWEWKYKQKFEDPDYYNNSLIGKMRVLQSPLSNVTKSGISKRFTLSKLVEGD